MILQLLQLRQALLELLFGWRVLADVADELDGVEAGLGVGVVEQLDDLVELIQVKYLHLALLILCQRAECAGSRSAHAVDFVGEHFAEWLDGTGFNSLLLPNSIVADGSQVHGGHLANLVVLGLEVLVQVLQDVAALDDEGGILAVQEDLH